MTVHTTAACTREREFFMRCRGRLARLLHDFPPIRLCGCKPACALTCAGAKLMQRCLHTCMCLDTCMRPRTASA
eukprot:scaffold65381_cov20-Tisochrysis_lutea.AAC.1